MAKSPTSTDRIVRTPGVAGGSARINGTRVPVWLLVHWSNAGWVHSRIRDEYAQVGLTDADIDAALSYAKLHPDEIGRELKEQDEDDA